MRPPRYMRPKGSASLDVFSWWLYMRPEFSPFTPVNWGMAPFLQLEYWSEMQWHPWLHRKLMAGFRWAEVSRETAFQIINISHPATLAAICPWNYSLGAYSVSLTSVPFTLSVSMCQEINKAPKRYSEVCVFIIALNGKQENIVALLRNQLMLQYFDLLSFGSTKHISWYERGKKKTALFSLIAPGFSKTVH